MAENMSLADRAIETLAAVRAMDKGMDISHPERHTVRNLKRAAEEALSNAFNQAQTLAGMATDVTLLVDGVRTEEAKRALETDEA